MTSSPQESRAAVLARIEAEPAISKAREISCEKWAIQHAAQIAWAMDNIQEERDPFSGIVDSGLEALTKEE